MEHHSLVSLADGSEYCVPCNVSALLLELDCARRWDEFAGLELSCGCGPVWINPAQVTAVQGLDLEPETEAEQRPDQLSPSKIFPRRPENTSDESREGCRCK